MQSEKPRPHNEKNQEEKADTATTSSLIKMASYARWLWERIKQFFAWWQPNRIMALFTIVIALVGFLQWKVYNAQLDEMRIDQRAWFGVKFTVFSPPPVGSPIPIPALAINVGKTIAKGVVVWTMFAPTSIGTTIDLSDPPPPYPYPPSDGPPFHIFYTQSPVWEMFRTGVIYPGDSFQLPLFMSQNVVGQSASESVVWNQDMQSQWSDGKIYLALHGAAVYYDVAGNSHETWFCSISTAPGKQVGLRTQRLCAAYNDVDNNK